jgi:hypothetical protein
MNDITSALFEEGVRLFFFHKSKRLLRGFVEYYHNHMC